MMIYLLRKLIILLFVVFICATSQAQKEDHKWLFGYAINVPYYDNNSHLDTTAGITVMDFNNDPPTLRYDSTLYAQFDGCNSCISDAQGHLLFYSNGFQIYSGNEKIILEDTIAYGQNWEDRKIINNKNEIVSVGSAFIHSSMILPLPNSKNLYMLFYNLWDNSFPEVKNVHTRYLFNAMIDMDPSIGPGRLVFKDNILVGDSLFIKDSLAVSGFASCRHGNGRDWWLVYPAKYQNRFYTFLIDPKGIHFYGVQESGERIDMGVGQVSFSPNGRRLGVNSAFRFSNDGSKVLFFEFDRRTGKITNPQGQHFGAGYGVSNGLAFSPDSRYAYVSNDEYIYQYDFFNPDLIGSRRRIAKYDGYEYVYPGTSTGFPVTLGWMGLAPDGRIYVSSGSGSNRKMGVIQYPNERGEMCEMRQHSLHITTNYVRTMPNFPNYRLGPWDGSYADTLGLDNNPIAKYRYEQDTMNYLKVRFTDLSYFRPESWHWDFGDGTTSTDRYPYHTFPSNDTYEVCLTVSNENSSNTVCRTLTFGTASTSEPERKEVEVNLYPSPVKDDLTLTIYDYLPQNGTVHFFDTKGQLMLTQKVYNGWNIIDMSRLISGTYVYQIMEGRVVVKSGKVVKVE